MFFWIYGAGDLTESVKHKFMNELVFERWYLVANSTKKNSPSKIEVSPIIYCKWIDSNHSYGDYI